METEAVVDWTELPSHLLSLILHRLSVPDFAQCRAVCRWWRLAAATEAPNGPTKSEPPYLLLAGDETDEKSEFRTLYSLSERMTYRLHLPQVRGHRFLGSGDGWVVTMDEFAELQLFNPLTGTQIALPSVTTFAGMEGTVRDGDGRITGYMYRDLLPESDESFFHDLEHMLECFFTRAMIFSSSSSSEKIVVFVIYSHRYDLAFARAGDKQWTGLEKPPILCLFSDVVYHKSVYYASVIDGQCIAYDIDSSETPKVTYIAPLCNGETVGKYYLAELGSELLEIWRHESWVPPEADYDQGAYHDDDGENDGNVYRTEGFTVFRLDSERNEWVRINNLGEGSVLFLGDNRAMTLSTREFPELKENCIYFTDGDGEQYREVHHMRRDVGIFHMEDGSIEPIYPHRSPLSRLTWPPPVWFTPRLY